MHACGIIIKPISMSVEDARIQLGDILVDRGLADWYSFKDYRERTFNGKQTIPLKEFVSKPFDTINHILFLKQEEEDYLSSRILYENEFFEFYDVPERKQLIKLYNTLYFKQFKLNLKDYESSIDDYDVVLLDYHC